MSLIKDAHIAVEGSSAVQQALASTAERNQYALAETIKYRYNYAASGAQETPDAALFIQMDAGKGKPNMLRAYVKEYHDPDSNIRTLKPQRFTEFEVNLAALFGKDWDAYLEMRAMAGRRGDWVRMYGASDARSDMHKLLAKKLQEFFEEKGIVSVNVGEDKDTYVEQDLLSLFCEYRRWMQDPQAAIDFVDGTTPRHRF
jgi:hypothetical protein